MVIIDGSFLLGIEAVIQSLGTLLRILRETGSRAPYLTLSRPERRKRGKVQRSKSLVHGKVA